MAGGNAAGTIVALDVGDKRIGVAAASLLTRMPRPVMTLSRTESIDSQLGMLFQQQQASAVVIGLPRNLDGNETEQTRRVRDFGERLASALSIPVYWTDEALTSVQAESELKARGQDYVRGDIDALAACYILTDFLAAHPEVRL